MENPESIVLLKYRHMNRSNQALAPISTRLKFLGKQALHSRREDPFNHLYNMSPIRKKEKLKEARMPNLNTVVSKKKQIHWLTKTVSRNK